MSYNELMESFEEAKNKPFYFIKGPTSEKVVSKAEALLGFKISVQHRKFYSEVGYLSFSGFEFYGICNDKFSGNAVICAIETTIKERKKYNLPLEWVLFCSFDDGYMGYLDYSKPNKHGEPPLIMVYYDGHKYEVLKKVSDDIGQYIKKCVKMQVNV